MTSTINKGLDKVKEGVTSAGEGIHDASDYVGAKMTGNNFFFNALNCKI